MGIQGRRACEHRRYSVESRAERPHRRSGCAFARNRNAPSETEPPTRASGCELSSLRALLGIAVFGVFALSLDGCSGQGASAGLPASGDSSLAVATRGSENTSLSPAAVDSAAVAEAALDAVDSTIDAAPPDVAGTYGGTIQDRSSGFVATGRIQLILHQSGSTVSGFIKTEAKPPPTDPMRGTIVVEHTFTGTASATTKGVLLKLSIADSQDQTEGLWAKVIGTTLFGKGWVDPNPTYNSPYEQLLFTLHKRT